MNILWFGTEDIDFPSGAIPTVVTTAGTFRSGYARCCLSRPGGGINIPPAVSNTFPGGSVTSCWFSFQMYRGQVSDLGCLIAGLTKSGKVGGPGLYVAVGASSTSKLQLATWDGSSLVTLATETGSSIASATTYKIDMQLTDYGASANVKVFVNGASVAVINFTGDVRIASMVDVDRVGFVGDNTNNRESLSEFIVADADTRTLSLATLGPSGAGSTMSMTGAYSDIDEVTISDADAIFTNLAGKDAMVTLSNTPAGVFSVIALMISARATKTADSSVSTLKLGTSYSGTTDLDAGQTLSTAWATYNRLMTTVNGNPITTAVLDGMELVMESAT